MFLALYEGDYESVEGDGPGVGDIFFEAAVGFAGFCCCGDIAEDCVGYVKEGLKAGVELTVFEVDHLHAAAKDGEFGGKRLRESLVAVVMSEGFEEIRKEGVELVVGAGGFPGEFEHAHVGGLYVEGDRANLIIYIEDDVAGFAFCVWHESADEAGEIAFHHFHEVALLKVDLIEGEVREAVFVGVCDIFEPGHCAVGDSGVTFFAAAVDHERESVWLEAELLHFGEGGFDEDVMESEFYGAKCDFSVFLFFDHVGGGKEFEGCVMLRVEAVDDFSGLTFGGVADVVEDVPDGGGISEGLRAHRESRGCFLRWPDKMHTAYNQELRDAFYQTSEKCDFRDRFR